MPSFSGTFRQDSTTVKPVVFLLMKKLKRFSPHVVQKPNAILGKNFSNHLDCRSLNRSKLHFSLH